MARFKNQYLSIFNFSNLYKVISLIGDICIIDEYFITRTNEEFSLFDINGNLLDVYRFPTKIFRSISMGIKYSNGKLFIATPAKKVQIVDLTKYD
jgi:hypothetical protein